MGEMGIIPARAGFTAGDERLTQSDEDHPRSRGVYWLLEHYGDGVIGIIPARAGFTRPSRSRPPARTDHPRSRGVYSPRRSPLAAG